MASPNINTDNRALKRSKMRESLESAFADPLLTYKTPKAVREISEALDNKSAELEARIRKISDSSDECVGDDLDQTSLYLLQREELVEDLNDHVQKAREAIQKARESSTRHQNNELKRALKELDQTDSGLLKERAALAADRIRFQYRIHGQPSKVKLGEAYRIALTDRIEKPAGASYDVEKQRSGTDQSCFRNRLLKAYQPDSSDIVGAHEDREFCVWCPISGKEFEQVLVKAAHIIPHVIGEANASYLLGAREDEGYGLLWSERNGLMLHHKIEQHFDDGRLVIIPDPSDENEFISLILCPKLREERCLAVGAPYSTIHKKRLQFKTNARPGKRFLYIHVLLTLFRRKRFAVSGYEHDRLQVLTGQIWATPGKWARRSMVEALALEFGDSWGNIEVKGLTEFPNRKSPEEEERIATVMRYQTEPSSRLTEDGGVEEDDGGMEEDDGGMEEDDGGMEEDNEYS